MIQDGSVLDTRGRREILSLELFAAFVSDQATKSWAERNSNDLRDHPMVVFDFIDGYEALVEFTYVTNPGAAWRMFSDYPQVLTALAGLALIGIFFFDAQNGWAVGSKNTIMNTTDGGATWAQQKTTTASDAIRAVVFTSLDSGLSAGSGGHIWKWGTKLEE